MAELITNEFTVNLPIDEAWPIICDVERIAPCLPGAELQEIEGTTYRGVVTIKLGAITANFKGEAEFVERDDTADGQLRRVLRRLEERLGIRGEPLNDSVDQMKRHCRDRDTEEDHHARVATANEGGPP